MRKGVKQILNSSVYKDIGQSFKWNITFNIEHHNLKIVDEILTKTELIEKIKNMQNNNLTLVDDMNCNIKVELVE